MYNPYMMPGIQSSAGMSTSMMPMQPPMQSTMPFPTQQNMPFQTQQNMPFPGSSNYLTNTTTNLENQITRLENHVKALDKRVAMIEQELHGNSLSSDNYQYSSLQMM